MNDLYPDLKVTPDSLRLREKSAEKLLSVYHDESVFEKYSMYDGKEIAIQIINSEDRIFEESDENYLLMVKEWDPSSWQLSDPKEIFIKKNATLEELAHALSIIFPHIPIEN